MVKCYTKKRSAENGGGNYTTCIGFQKGGKAKPKTIKIKRKKKKVKGVPVSRDAFSCLRV